MSEVSRVPYEFDSDLPGWVYGHPPVRNAEEDAMVTALDIKRCLAGKPFAVSVTREEG